VTDDHLIGGLRAGGHGRSNWDRRSRIGRTIF